MTRRRSARVASPASHPAQHHDVGQDSALFYAARASFLELRSCFASAREVYESGVARCARAPSRAPARRIG